MTIFVNQGDAPLTPAQLEKRAQKYIKRSWPDQDREKSIRLADGAFDAFMTTFSANHQTNKANNTFNIQLADYTQAVTRLNKYVLLDGVPEKTEEFDTGEIDPETGEPIIETFVTPAIEPLEEMVTVTEYDEDGNATETEIRNPLIVTDEEERATAQTVVDNTPQEVIDFYNTLGE